MTRPQRHYLQVFAICAPSLYSALYSHVPRPIKGRDVLRCGGEVSMARAAKPCPEPRCPGLRPCELHPDPKPWASSSRSGSTAKWRKIRAVALRRDDHRCVKCGAPATEVDHIVNKAQGGTDSLSNLQSLCSPCHQAKTQAESAAARRT